MIKRFMNSKGTRSPNDTARRFLHMQRYSWAIMILPRIPTAGRAVTVKTTDILSAPVHGKVVGCESACTGKRERAEIGVQLLVHLNFVARLVVMRIFSHNSQGDRSSRHVSV